MNNNIKRTSLDSLLAGPKLLSTNPYYNSGLIKDVTVGLKLIRLACKAINIHKVSLKLLGLHDCSSLVLGMINMICYRGKSTTRYCSRVVVCRGLAGCGLLDL